jgi:hypothetical protein
LLRAQANNIYGQLLRLAEVLCELRRFASDHLAPPTASLFVYLRKSSEGTEVVKQITSAMHVLSQCATKGACLEAKVRATR